MDGIAHRTITVAGTGDILRRYLYSTAHYFIAIILLAAGVLKIYDPAPLLGSLELLQFINNSHAILIAIILPVIEIGLGVLLLTKLRACEQNIGNPVMNTASVRLPGELITSDNTLSLVTFFTDRGCAPCVIDEIGLINNMLEQYKEYMNIYLVDGHERYLVNLGTQFRYDVIDATPELEDLQISNPVSLLIDRNGAVHHIHYAETGNAEKSRLFFKKVNSLFESVYGG